MFVLALPDQDSENYECVPSYFDIEGTRVDRSLFKAHSKPKNALEGAMYMSNFAN